MRSYQTWEPPKANGGIGLAAQPAAGPADVVALLVSIYGSKELFISEYRWGRGRARHGSVLSVCVGPHTRCIKKPTMVVGARMCSACWCPSTAPRSSSSASAGGGWPGCGACGVVHASLELPSCGSSCDMTAQTAAVGLWFMC